MRVKILRSPGVREFEQPLAGLKEGQVVELSKGNADLLLDRRPPLAKETNDDVTPLDANGDPVFNAPQPLFAAAPTAPVANATTDSGATESDVKDLGAPDAITKISTMRSKEKLEGIVSGDTRVTVQDAAKKRLSELG